MEHSNKVFANIQMLMHGMRRIIHQAHTEESTHPSTGQARLLGLFNHLGGEIPQKELEKMMGIRSSSISELLIKLENSGLIQRRPNPKDRRSMIVSLTEEGFAAAELAKKEHEEFEEFILQGINKEEQDQLNMLLEKLMAPWNLNENEPDFFDFHGEPPFGNHRNHPPQRPKGAQGFPKRPNR